MGQEDVRADATQDRREPAQRRPIVEHLEVADQALVIREPADTACGDCLIAPDADQFVRAVDARSARPVRHRHVVNLVAGTLQAHERARRRELDVVGMGEHGQSNWHDVSTRDDSSFS